MMTAAHLPVMVEPVLRILNPRPGERIIDATVGLGGHAERILRALGPDGQLIGIDRDPRMLRRAEAQLPPFGVAVSLVDLTATMLDMSGLPLDRRRFWRLDGDSLLPLIRG